MTRPPANRFAYLDGLRGWAALLVVFHHGIIAIDFALYTGQPADSRGHGDIWLSGTLFFPFGAGGNLAVCIFFALSGFVLAHAYMRSRQYWLSLAVRRYVRLGLPMLAGCLLAWMLLALGLMRNHAAAQLTNSSWLGIQFQQTPNLMQAVLEPLNLLFGAESSLKTSYDSSLWTMPIEAEVSLVLITTFVLLRHAGKHAQRIGAYAFGTATVLCAGSFFSLFAFGATLRLLQPTRIQAWLGGGHRLIVILVLGFFLGTVPYSVERLTLYNRMAALARPIVQHAGLWPHSPESFWHGIGAALILLAVSSSLPLQSVLSHPISTFLGRISFPLYILHIPVLMVIQSHAIIVARQADLPPFGGDVISLLLFIIIAVAISALLTPLIEGGAVTLSSRVGQAIDTLIELSVARIVKVVKGPRRPTTLTFY